MAALTCDASLPAAMQNLRQFLPVWLSFAALECSLSRSGSCQAEARHGEILGELLYAAKIVAEKEGILDGFRVVINDGPSACK